MVGRRKSRAYDVLDYELVRINNKHAASCNICKKNLFNTAVARLQAHRNVCKILNKKSTNSSNFDKISESETRVTCYIDETSNVLNLPNIDMEKDPIAINKETDLLISNNIESPVPSKLSSSSEKLLSLNSPKSFSNSRKRSISTQKCISTATFADRLSQNVEDGLEESFVQFLYKCNIPLSIVDSVYFKNFVKKINPAYADEIPRKKVLSAKLLDIAYENCLASAQDYNDFSKSVLLIDK